MAAMQQCYALVLTSSPAAPALSDFAVERAASLIPAGAEIQRWWLAPREAWEALFVSGDPDEIPRIRQAVASALNGITTDVNIVPADIAYRRRKLLVADMESTIIGQEMLDELADLVGLRARIAAITERAMRGELDFEAALAERVGLLAGLDARVLEETYRARVTLMPGARTLVATMKAHGATCALVSGGFTVFTERVARTVGFDLHRANTLEIRDGRLAGTVRRPILGREAKLAALEELRAGRKLLAPDTLAVGDGANDLAMIAAAGLGVAFRAKPKVQEAAAGLLNGAVVTHGDLTALLYLQGYKRQDFVE